MQHDTPSEARLAGAILGPLFPPLDLAADDLYERVNARERVDGTYVPSRLGFETGVMDHVLIEAFQACVPAVKSLLAAGGTVLIAEWVRHRSSVQRRAEELEWARKERQAFRDSLERLIELLLRHSTLGSRSQAEAKIRQVLLRVPERTAGADEEDDEACGG